MNVPIFRAWSNKYNKMFRVTEISQDREGYTHGLIDAETEDEFRPTQDEFQNNKFVWIGRVNFTSSPSGRTSGLFQDPNEERFILMQYSGLTGSYEKDFIFEGDIISYEDEYGEHNKGQVIKEKGAFYFRPISRVKQEDILLNLINDVSEIIGNIYENDNLLTA